MGGHVNGWLDPSTDEDYYRVLVGEAGTYSFQTHGWFGACGLGTQVNTAIELLHEGNVWTTNVNRDAATHDFCSAITRHLEPGLYPIRVASSTAGVPRSFERQSVGYYRISARPVN